MKLRICIFWHIHGKCCKPITRVKVSALQAVEHLFFLSHIATHLTCQSVWLMCWGHVIHYVAAVRMVREAVLACRQQLTWFCFHRLNLESCFHRLNLEEHCTWCCVVSLKLWHSRSYEKHVRAALVSAKICLQYLCLDVFKRPLDQWLQISSIMTIVFTDICGTSGEDSWYMKVLASNAHWIFHSLTLELWCDMHDTTSHSI